MTTPRRLTRMLIDKVSLVDAGANARRFAVLKRQPEPVAEPAPPPEPEPIPEPVPEQPAVPAPVSKGEGDPVDALRDELWRAMVAKGTDGRPLPLVQKRVLFTKAIDQFRSANVVEKGKPQFSASRLGRLKEAHSTIGALIAEAEPKDGKPASDWWGPQSSDAVAKESTMTPEELVDAVRPLIAEAVAAANTPPAPAEGEVTLADVAEALTKMVDRVEALEKSRSQAIQGQDFATPVAKKSVFAGIL